MVGAKRGLGILLACAVAGIVVGCSSEDGSTDGPNGPAAGGDEMNEAPGDAPMTEDQLRERPWEVVSNKGETYLENVFYAEASENEQIIPWALGKPQIDRMIYPTLGNPNLYVKDDAGDELTMVLRVEPDAYQHLVPKVAASEGDAPRAVEMRDDANDGFAFFLVARSARAQATEASSAQAAGAGVFRIVPKKILQNAEPADMPAVFAKRKTLRFVFDQAAMANVPPGLYDARFEIRKGGQVYANVFEYQYNAVRVFDHVNDEYQALNVTDTQVSIGPAYQTLTADKLEDFVTGVNGTTDPEVRNAAFITFNGDLHNGGSPETFRSRAVSLTYQQESKRIIQALKKLDFPIFLTAGNHDGYVGLGHVPSAIETLDAKLGDPLKKVISEQNNIAWPGYTWDAYNAFLQKTDAKRDGLHVDVTTGGFARQPGRTFTESWKEVPRAERNWILYDGFNQWQKSYGPLYASWTFGKNRYLSINSYELRQHRRTGWGMYTVNYGGAVGKTQMEWIDRELARGKSANEDVVMLMHHDPRGGHAGKDFGYYFPLIEYRSVQQSTLNYIMSSKLTPLVCSNDSLSLSVDEQDACLHDGLQEWHAPDVDFDKDGGGFYFSAVELLKRIARNPHVRTVVLGHTHYNSLEVIQKGEELVPSKVALTDDGSVHRIQSAEAANPIRRYAWEGRLLKDENEKLSLGMFDGWRSELDGMLERAATKEQRLLSNPGDTGPRELAVLRLTSAADLSSQKYGSAKMYGYSVLHVTKQDGVPRVNRVTYFINKGNDTFAKVRTVDVDRTKSMASRGADNPVDQLFDW